MQALIPINIVIGDRQFRIKIQPEDEGTVRSTLKTINDKIIEFKTQFAGKDMQDYIAMVLIWYATQAASTGNNQQLESEFEKILSGIEHQIDKVL